MTLEHRLELLLCCKQAYYLCGSSSLNDHEYDRLKDKLRKEYPEHPLLEMVGYDSELAQQIRSRYVNDSN